MLVHERRKLYRLKAEVLGLIPAVTYVPPCARVAIIGEGSLSEAVIPLPDNKTVPMPPSTVAVNPDAARVALGELAKIRKGVKTIRGAKVGQ